MLPIDVDEEGNLLYEGGIEPIVIRTSDRTNYKKCRRLWHYSSPLGLERESTRMNHNLAFGIDFHIGMERYYDPDLWGQEELEARINGAVVAFVEANKERMAAEKEANRDMMSDERMAEYREREELGIGMFRQYHAEVTNPSKEHNDDGWTPIAVEWKFQVTVIHPETGKPLVVNGRPVVYQVRLDLVAEDADGRVWAWDHKTAGNVTGDTSFLDLDTQLSSYLWALQRKLGKPVAGMVYNEVAKRVPQPPKVLKAGNLSTDKRQITTYDLYVAKIEELALDPAPYGAMLDYLAANDGGYFRRSTIPRSTKELAIQGEYVYQEALEMASSPAIYPNPSKMHCGGCDFRTPCTVANEGGDDLFVLNDPMFYRDREKG